MFIVRKQDLLPDGGASYLVEASKAHDSKYRWGKTRRMSAMTFSTKRTATNWATRMGGEVVGVS
jgi:hypothetical protein